MATTVRRGNKWYMVYKDRTGRQRMKVGLYDQVDTLRNARALEDEESKIASGFIDHQAEAHRIERAKPVIDHVAKFKAHLDSKAVTRDHVAYTIRDVELCVAFSGIVAASALTFDHVDSWRAHCLKVGYPSHNKLSGPCKPDSRATANRRVGSVRAWLRYLRDRVGAVDQCCIEGYRKLKTKGYETFQRRALTVEEVRLLLSGCPDPHRCQIYRFVLLTGLRQKEVRGMTPSCFDFKNLNINIPANVSKSGLSEYIPMNTGLVPILKELVKGKLPTSPVFHLKCDNDIVPTLLADCVAAGVDTTDVDFHGLRHTFCTRLAENNVRPELLHKLARHQDAQTTLDFYIHTTTEDIRGATNLLLAG